MGRRIKNIEILRTSWLLVLALLFVSVAAPAASAVDVSSSTALAPIPVEEVSLQAESTLDNLHDVATATDPAMESVKSELSLYTREIDARLAENAKLLRSSPSLDILRYLQMSLT